MKTIKIDRFLYFVILAIAFFIAINKIGYNFNYLIVLTVYIIVGLLIRTKIKDSLFLLALFFIGHCFLLSHLSNNFFNESNVAIDSFQVFMPGFIVSSLILALPYYFISLLYKIKIGTDSIFEKQHYKKKKRTELICKEHYFRPSYFTITGKRIINCKANDGCNSESNLIKAYNLIGKIGLIEDDRIEKGDFVITLWNHCTQEFKDGDYDIIEIYENPEIKDYNSIINKISTYFFNEIERLIPVFGIKVRIFGKLNLTESTKRLLEERFLKVEYFKINKKNDDSIRST